MTLKVSEMCLFFSLGYKHHIHKQDDTHFPDWMEVLHKDIPAIIHQFADKYTKKNINHYFKCFIPNVACMETTSEMKWMKQNQLE